MSPSILTALKLSKTNDFFIFAVPGSLAVSLWETMKLLISYPHLSKPEPQGNWPLLFVYLEIFQHAEMHVE